MTCDALYNVLLICSCYVPISKDQEKTKVVSLSTYVEDDCDMLVLWQTTEQMDTHTTGS